MIRPQGNEELISLASLSPSFNCLLSQEDIHAVIGSTKFHCSVANLFTYNVMTGHRGVSR